MAHPAPHNRNEACLVYSKLSDLDRHRSMRLGLPVRRKSRSIPWGYVAHEKDPKLLEPVDSMFVLLVEAKKQLDDVTYKDIAEWLTSRTGVKISNWGIQQVYETRMPFNEAALPRAKREQL